MTTSNDYENGYLHDDTRAILDKIHEGVIILNGLGSITFVNMNFQELVGYSQRNLEGLRFDQLIEILKLDISAAEAKEHWQNIINGFPTVLTLRIKHKEGYLIHQQIDASARYDKVGEFCGVLLICRDFCSDLLSQIIQTINSS